MRDPETYERYDQVIVMHTCREVAELEYGRQLVESLADDPLIGEFAGDKLHYYPTTTRESPSGWGGSPTTSPRARSLPISACRRWTRRPTGRWSAARWRSTSTSRRSWKASGLREGANSDPAEYVVEKAFVGDLTCPRRPTGP
jgi:ferredoxin/flavodoxin---NADP+ reductase